MGVRQVRPFLVGIRRVRPDENSLPFSRGRVGVRRVRPDENSLPLYVDAKGEEGEDIMAAPISRGLVVVLWVRPDENSMPCVNTEGWILAVFTRQKVTKTRCFFALTLKESERPQPLLLPLVSTLSLRKKGVRLVHQTKSRCLSCVNVKGVRTTGLEFLVYATA